MTVDVSLRSARPEDLAPLCELYCRSVRCNPDGFIQDLSFHGCLIEKCREWRSGGGDLVVARHGGEVVGLCGLAPCGAACAELCKLHVSGHMQGHGVGRQLAEHVIAEAAGRFREIELHVTASQQAAIGLYRRLGFRETHRSVYRTIVFGVEAAFDTIYMRLPLHEG